MTSPPGADPARAADTFERQWQASDPDASAWVVANAGSGKTHVLTQRVLRLLLAGADPASILCLTYTKAAASEMANRIFKELAIWAWSEDPALDRHIEALQGALPRPGQRAAARALFAKALDTPGGLRVQTIHAFCERLLHQFPIEANVPGRFEVLEGPAQEALMTAAREKVMRRAANEAGVAEALQTMAELAADSDIFGALQAMLAKREALADWKRRVGNADGPGSLAGLIDDLDAAFQLQPGDNEETVAERFLGDQPLTLIGAHGAELLRQLEAHPGATNDTMADWVRQYLGARSAAEKAAAALSFYLKADGSPKSPGRALTKAVQGSYQNYYDQFDSDAQLCLTLRNDLLAVRTVAATTALLTVADRVLAEYAKAKKASGALDFDDLVFRTRNLLSRSAMRDWVLYKLDSGIAHILVDEAQDTNPAQWEIVQALAEDFFSGDTARTGVRSLFAVGDDKQSIYSFQGAVPAKLAEMRDRFRSDIEGAGLRFAEKPLFLSFRSAQAVLAAVDRVFSGDLEQRITRLGYEAHAAYHTDRPGDVVIWDRVVRRKGDPPENWTDPYDAPSIADIALADRIVDEIANLLERREDFPAPMPAEPGEILVLTRKRDAFFRAVNSALKARRIPAVGADRIEVAKHIIVQDLLALSDVIGLPEDDLQLAACLKSPLFGLTDEDILEFAPQRGRMSLLSALQARDSEKARRASTKLSRWRQQAQLLTPFAFFARLLAVDGGYRDFHSRFGAEADDVLDMFLTEARVYEERNPPTLQGFAAYLRAGAGDIKRDHEGPAGGVRVMTVHGAKGLEADFVFLVDTGGAVSSACHREPVLALAEHSADFGWFGAPPLVWRRKAAEATGRQGEADRIADAAAEAEYARLLYVAMTRARRRLYVCGIRGPMTPADCWYGLVERKLVPSEAARDDDGELAEPFWWPPRTPGQNDPVRKPAARSGIPDPAVAGRTLPEWMVKPVPSPGLLPIPLRPSRALAEPDPVQPDGDRMASGAMPDATVDMAAALRGTVIHGLLQKLPDVDPEMREAAARDHLRSLIPDDAAQAEALAREALNVVAAADFARFFGPRSRAEVEIGEELTIVTGKEGRGRKTRTCSVSGRIDRLAIHDDRIDIVDFKTGRQIPRRADEIDPAIVGQLALYRHAVSRILPGRPVVAHIIWTAKPSAMTVPARALDSALARLGIETAGAVVD